MMYDSLILRSVARLMLPLLLLLSVFMLLRGHNLPGGGFIGGLVAASALILQMVAFGPTFLTRVLPVSYLALAAVGVGFAALWGLPALVLGQPYMAAYWLPFSIPGIGKIGTPVLFDVGVYLAVVGMTTQVALLLAEEPILFPLSAEPLAGDQRGDGAPRA